MVKLKGSSKGEVEAKKEARNEASKATKARKKEANAGYAEVHSCLASSVTS
jgi:hypothetical protein